MIRPIHITEDNIRELAYRLWLEDGQPQGKSAEHWEKARNLLILGIDPGEGAGGVAAAGEFATMTVPGGKRRPNVARKPAKRRPM